MHVWKRSSSRTKPILSNCIAWPNEGGHFLQTLCSSCSTDSARMSSIKSVINKSSSSAARHRLVLQDLHKDRELPNNDIKQSGQRYFNQVGWKPALLTCSFRCAAVQCSQIFMISVPGVCEKRLLPGWFWIVFNLLGKSFETCSHMQHI